MSTKKRTAAERRTDQEKARETLRALLPPGSTVYTILRHRAASGMSRHVSLLVIDPTDTTGFPLVNITYKAAEALGRTCSDWHGYNTIRVDGCGFDAGFDLVNGLSYALHGFEAVGADAIAASAAGRPFTPRADAYRAGYSLRQEWI